MSGANAFTAKRRELLQLAAAGKLAAPVNKYWRYTLAWAERNGYIHYSTETYRWLITPAGNKLLTEK